VGSQQSYVVPAGVTQLEIECYGASGGNYAGYGTGGKGGYIQATIPTTPGETLYVNVGGAGGTFNGAGTSGTAPFGGGGGMSDVRQGGTATSNIVVVGGGGGGCGVHANGGFGGSSGFGGGGGVAGGLAYGGGGGATTSSGGSAGGGTTAGGPGSAFTGGNGAYAGGGGSGYYGGGGGGTVVGGSGGGGGGSSWAGATAFNVSYKDGKQTGNGVVKISIPAPPSPTLNTPYSGQNMDVSGGVTLAWTYNQSAAGTTQTGYQARRATGGAYHYWNGSNWTSASPVTVNVSTQSAATTGWSNGNTYNWSIATKDSNGLGAFAADYILNAVGPPTVSVTAPTGTATTDPVAHIAWTPTTPAGSEATWRAIVYTAAQYGAGGFAPGVGPNAWDSLLQGGTAVAVNSTALTNATYRAYVQISQTGGLVSAWAFSGFVINCTVPPTPTLVAALDSPNVRNVLTVTAGAGSQPVSVQYSDDLGVTWTPVRNGTAIATGGGNVATIYDYEACPLVPRGYRAMAQTALLVPSLWSATVTVTNTTPGFWLSDPLTPQSAVRIYLQDGIQLDTNFPESLTIHRPPGRPDAIVISDVVALEEGGGTFWTRSVADEAALMALLLQQKTLLFQSYDGRQWYIRITSPRPTANPFTIDAGSLKVHVLTWVGQNRP
jgi:hypothetical protein